MKTIQLLLILIAFSCSALGQKISKQTSENFKKLNWLVGTWNRTNTKAGRSGLEQWIKIGQQELLGTGVNMRDADTVFVEKLRIIVKDDYIAYVADVPENKKLVYFKLTEITKTGFVCENPDHDFPKKISYQLEGRKLKAQISGDGKVIEYLFEKK